MTPPLDKSKVEQYKNEILKDNSIRGIDYSNAEQRVALIELCESNTTIRNMLDDTPEQREVLHELAKKSYRIVEKFLPSQLFDEVVREYLNHALSDTDIVGRSEGGKCYAISREGEPTIKVNFSTNEKNVLYYHDSDLDLVTYFIYDIDLYVKVVNSSDFYMFLDCPINMINMEKVLQSLKRYLAESVRKAIDECIISQCIGFYSLASQYSNVENRIKTLIDDAFSSAGLCVYDCFVKSLTIPKNIINEVQEQSYLLSKKWRENESKLRYEEQSLEIFDKKCAILSKYEMDDGLTEVEKDYALNRYIARVNNIHEDDEFNPQELTAASATTFGTKKASKPTPPTPPVAPLDKSKSSLSLSIFALIIGAIALIIGIVIEHSTVIAIGIIGLILGGVFVALTVNRKKQYNTSLAAYASAKKAYQNAREIYENNLRLYNEELETTT